MEVGVGVGVGIKYVWEPRSACGPTGSPVRHVWSNRESNREPARRLTPSWRRRGDVVHSRSGARAGTDRLSEGGSYGRLPPRLLTEIHVCSERMRVDDDREADTQATQPPAAQFRLAPSAGTLVPGTRQDQVPSALCYQDQLRQSPGLPGTTLVALGALPV